MKSFISRIIEAGPSNYVPVLQEAMFEFSDKINAILHETDAEDAPILAAALHLASQAILSQTGEPGKKAYDDLLRISACLTVPDETGERP